MKHNEYWKLLPHSNSHSGFTCIKNVMSECVQRQILHYHVFTRVLHSWYVYEESTLTIAGLQLVYDVQWYPHFDKNAFKSSEIEKEKKRRNFKVETKHVGILLHVMLHFQDRCGKLRLSGELGNGDLH